MVPAQAERSAQRALARRARRVRWAQRVRVLRVRWAQRVRALRVQRAQRALARQAQRAQRALARRAQRAQRVRARRAQRAQRVRALSERVRLARAPWCVLPAPERGSQHERFAQRTAVCLGMGRSPEQSVRRRVRA
jgi:hypothetical protein